ncbi:MaoC family dehydratase [Mesorhizobium sp. KR1-2]|uniref:MaoC family dehydratase n=1 Tax=Mesorhizobium sp. KR1-2 TaxID=3156609 RepID=UPI0032B574E8
MAYEQLTIPVNLLAGFGGRDYQIATKTREKVMAGLYLEEFVVGQVVHHALTKTVTESDNMLFSVMTLNPQPLHIDFDFAAKSEWGKPLVNSLFTLGLMIGISVHDMTLGTTIANLGMTETVFPNPVFHGDTIRVETEVLSVRDSKSKPDRGIVEFEHRAYNQNGVLVAKCIRQAMMKKKTVSA